MFNRQQRSQTPSQTSSQTHSTRFSGWALDDDVENTQLQNQEACDSGIPRMPPTPSRPHRQQSSHHYTPTHTSSHVRTQSSSHNLFGSSENPIPSMISTWSYNPDQTPSSTPTPTLDWGSPPMDEWSACWDSCITNPPVPKTRLSKDNTAAASPVSPTSTKVSSPLRASVTAPTEHSTGKPLFGNDYYHGYLETRCFTHPSLGRIHYITIEDVFEYVTLGRTISDSYLDELTSYITTEVPTDVTRTRDETTFHGRVYERVVPLYSWEQYGTLARHCLEWSLSNPEKLSR